MEKRSCKSCGISESAPFQVIGADDTCIGCRGAAAEEIEEGSICPECHEGSMLDAREGGCCCHLGHPPCGHCTTLNICCDECDFQVIESY